MQYGDGSFISFSNFSDAALKKYKSGYEISILK